MKGKKFLVITPILVFVLLWIAAGPGFAIHLKTNKGPALYESEHNLHVFFKGHNNNYIWHATYSKGRRSWQTPERVTDGSGSWALTRDEPGVGSVANRALKLAYRGHNNERIWYTTKWRGEWRTPRSIPRARSSHAPAVTSHADPSCSHCWTPTKVLHKGQTSEYIYTRDYNYPYCDHGQLPRTVKTSIGPCAIGGYWGPIVIYRGVGRDNQIYVYYRANISSLPRAFTNNTPAAALHQTGVRRSILVAYVGHNNNHIWLRSGYQNWNDSLSEWRRLGYIPGVATQERPALSQYMDTLYLAFKPIGSTEIAVGTLEVDYRNRPDTAGHRWTSIR